MMTCIFIIFMFYVITHLVVLKLAEESVNEYILSVSVLLRSGRYTDGCSTPFKTYVHRWLSHSHDLCAAHDYGSLGLIPSARPGWHNNWMTWLAHMYQAAPIYWIWGTIVALITLPWVVWRRNWKIEVLDMTAFYVILLVLIALPFLIYYQPSQ